MGTRVEVGRGAQQPDHHRGFNPEHWDYDAERIDGFDHDICAVLVKATTANGEAQLTAALDAWNLRPEQFLHPWQTDDPK